MGAYINVNNINFKVIGVYRLPSKNDEDYEEEAKAVFLPLSTFQQVFSWGETVGWFSITSEPQVKASVVRDEVIRVLASRHAIAPEDERAFGSWNMEDEFQKIADLFVGIQFEEGEGDIAYVGITDYAQEQLGDIVFVDRLPSQVFKRMHQSHFVVGPLVRWP